MGLPVISVGEGLRVWSQSSIVKKKELTVWGPYAYLRNPLYLSNFLIGLGFMVILYNPWLLLIYLTGFGMLYSRIIGEEENSLLARYGALYRDYCARVPRIFPKFVSVSSPSKPFRWSLVFKNGEHVTFLSILLILIGLYLRQEWFQDRKIFFPARHLMIDSAFFLAAILAGCLLYRKLHKK